MAEAAQSGAAQMFRMYVDGTWTDASGGKTYDIVNPATEAVIARAPNATLADMQKAIAAARRDRKSTRLNSSHIQKSRMPSSA